MQSGSVRLSLIAQRTQYIAYLLKRKIVNAHLVLFIGMVSILFGSWWEACRLYLRIRFVIYNNIISKKIVNKRHVVECTDRPTDRPTTRQTRDRFT